MKIIAIIPARGGSKGIPRKNIRIMNGKPLISYAIQTTMASEWITETYVSTDDEEIANIAGKYGAKVIKRPACLGEDAVTLDPVIMHATEEAEKLIGVVDIVITIQPTSPLLRTETLDNAIRNFIEKELETVISVVNKPHLTWREGKGKYMPNYTERVNRQYLPKNLLETGGFVITKRNCVKNDTRFGEKLDLFEIPEEEAIDIDSYEDWIVCETLLKKKKIIIRTEGYPEIGLGHIYRSILLRDNLLEHDVLIVLSEKSSLGIKKIQERFLPYQVIKEEKEFWNIVKRVKPDIIINDILDTTPQFIQKEKLLAKRVINFEDNGEGAKYADAVINALYEQNIVNSKCYYGVKYYCLRDEFLIAKPKEFKEKVENVLFLFGGTDPAGYTERMLEVIENIPENLGITYQFVLGLGFDREDFFMEKVRHIKRHIEVVKNVPMVSVYMEKADIAIAGQGRTMYELASMGVPSIVLAQNERETLHEFGNMGNGFINLGMGKEIDAGSIAETLLWLIHTPQIRKQMKMSMQKINLSEGIVRVKNIIIGNL